MNPICEKEKELIISQLQMFELAFQYTRAVI